ncbi:UbiA family prenyltransferase [Maritimibacter fusiformis]|uniref:UbiA family prenyltransferase n=1 Tax=Maritimibacter fusiformis TaxID=2603819 RepID=A0A5D0RPP1_9RHOB|nr:UbiA family prenyltransferase [Maritimibacter fusiformis]TYB82966.1 UbiA family prenyltransferase [Maritimibacter fusiformis]
MTDKPLVLDVDGTFLATDMLLECFWAGLGRDPIATLAASVRHVTRPERLKAELARIAGLRTELLPVNSEVAALAATALAQGREVVLASASDRTLVTRLAADYGLSERVFASDESENLKGARKARALVAAYGEGGFDYAGNAPVDRKVWAHADTAIVVGDPASARQIEAKGKEVMRLPGGWRPADLARALRPHQWVKNVLLFLPLLAGHVFVPGPWFAALIGLIAFSLAASSIYVVNDLLDLEADRLHPTKRNRPFASGKVPIGVGMAAGVASGLAALIIAAFLGWPMLGIVTLYMALSLAYSLRLKRLRWIDIATLASLYTIRVVAGALASGVGISGHLIAFVFPVFIALGAVKRITELTLATSDDRLPGRGYGRSDRGDLLNVAVLGMVGALLSFFLYSFTDQARALYPTRLWLWLALVPIGLWLVRMIRMGWLGRQDYDPIVFALTDKRGLGLLMIALGLMFQAARLWGGWLGL